MNQSYLDQLPDVPCVAKVNAAISERAGSESMYHVPLRDVEHWERVFSTSGNRKGNRVIRLARGCSALTRHSTLQKSLKGIGMQHIARRRRVQTLSLGILFRKHHVGSVGILALDCEGYDCSVLKGLLRFCKTRPHLYPHWICFESNGMNDELFGRGTEQRTVEELCSRGYKLWWGGGYERTGKRDTLLKFFGDRCADR